MGFQIIHYESEGDYPIRPNDYFYCAVYNATVYSHNNTVQDRDPWTTLLICQP